MATDAVVFDVMGTLFNLSPLRERLAKVGAPAGALEAWFGRMLHAAATLTLVGEFHPFREVATTTLDLGARRRRWERDRGRRGAYKPHPALYHHAASRLRLPLDRLALVAAHGWEVVGASSAGMQAVCVERLERRWPFPTPEPSKGGGSRRVRAPSLRSR
jgi:FMN phosphatase YigB (HAD superfamily)